MEGEGELVGGREVEANPVSVVGDCTCTDPYNNESRYYQNKTRLLHPVYSSSQAVIEIATLPCGTCVALYRELPVPQKTEIFGKTEVGEIDFNEIERLAARERAGTYQ